MGDKMVAKDTARKAGVPIVPGSKAIIKSKEEALKVAKEIKYPVIIKAAAGGGGKGMRICHNDVRLISALLTAQREAEAAFGNADVYIEKYVEKPRHVEIQILGDQHGHIIHLGERDCTIQRRHQKLIEESPSPIVDSKLRKKISDAAIKCAKAINYVNAGTIEFLVDSGGNFYFMEMNTRIQVEHPVTEAVTGLDLVKEQIRIAAGEKLFSFGDKSDEIYFILRGEVRLDILLPDGRWHHAATHHQGDFIGEMGFLDGRPRVDFAVAITEVEVMVLARQKFDQLAENHRRLGALFMIKIAHVLASRLRQTSEELRVLGSA
jgi:biotin carboxylase